MEERNNKAVMKEEIIINMNCFHDNPSHNIHFINDVL